MENKSITILLVLDGVKSVDLADLKGFNCAKLLSGFRADVIRVEGIWGVAPEV